MVGKETVQWCVCKAIAWRRVGVGKRGVKAGATQQTMRGRG